MKDYTTNNFKKKIFAKKGSNQNKKDICRINLYKNFILLI
ncbi:acyltransferase [Rickettsia prowazekii str. GvF12]|nr:Methionine aminopeptidase [Rickettsia prowazekii str. NMRC Madrid E]EOB10249.1 acyltransferase [Rickettsia prowazekii str. GvF12]